MAGPTSSTKDIEAFVARMEAMLEKEQRGSMEWRDIEGRLERAKAELERREKKR